MQKEVYNLKILTTYGVHIKNTECNDKNMNYIE